MLEVQGISVFYGDARALEAVHVQVAPGEVVGIVGPNGAGKSTLVKSIMGLVPVRSGSIQLGGTDITNWPPHHIARLGVALVPEGRRVFPWMSVRENLEMGAYPPAARQRLRDSLEAVYALFPRLRERQGQLAGTLSGGEQEMLVIARALMACPRILLLDEPSLGLSPMVAATVFEVIRTLQGQGLGILLVEQNVRKTLEVASRVYVLERGRVVKAGPAHELAQDEDIQRAYLGLETASAGG